MKTIKEFLNEARKLGSMKLTDQTAEKFVKFLVKASQQIDRIKLSNNSDTIILHSFNKSVGGGRPHTWSVDVIKGNSDLKHAQAYTGKMRAPYGDIMEIFKNTTVDLEEA